MFVRSTGDREDGERGKRMENIIVQIQFVESQRYQILI